MGSLRFHCCAQTATELERSVVYASCDCISEPFYTLQSLSWTFFRQFFFLCRSSFANWWAHLLGMAREMCRLELSRAARFQSSPEKVRWRINCLWLRVTRAVLRAEMTICWNIIGGKSSLPTLGSKSTLSLQCQRNHAHVCKRSDEGNRVSGCDDSRLVTDFVHDLGHPQLHMSIVRS